MRNTLNGFCSSKKKSLTWSRPRCPVHQPGSPPRVLQVKAVNESNVSRLYRTLNMINNIGLPVKSGTANSLRKKSELTAGCTADDNEQVGRAEIIDMVDEGEDFNCDGSEE